MSAFADTAPLTSIGESMENQPTTDTDLVATRDQLLAQLADLRAARETDESAATALPHVLREIAATRRDRDAEMSAELERYRAEIERGMAEVEEMVVEAARLWTRVQIARHPADDPRMRAARRAFEVDFLGALKRFGVAVNSADGA